MILKLKDNLFVPLSILCLALSPLAGLSQTNSWSLASPDGQCKISVSLEDGNLSYQALRAKKIVIQKSPLGLQRDDQNFERGLFFTDAGKIESHLEKYKLFAGPQPQVNHLLNFRSLTFRNTNNVPIEIDLAASDEGVAFRYRFPETNHVVCVIESELTSFTIPLNAHGWMQPYHAAGPYTPAYEDFYFPVSPGDPPPNSRAKAVGWAFPALFHVPRRGHLGFVDGIRNGQILLCVSFES